MNNVSKTAQRRRAKMQVALRQLDFFEGEPLNYLGRKNRQSLKDNIDRLVKRINNAQNKKNKMLQRGG
jgi:hypothetical protein